MRPSTFTAGQASVEIVALIPLLVAVVLAVVHVLAAGAAGEAAGSAAEAGAVAILQDHDPCRAVGAALGPGTAERATVRLRGRSITVTVRPRAVLSPLARLLRATSTADAGPGPPVTPARPAFRGGDGDASGPGPRRPGPHTGDPIHPDRPSFERPTPDPRPCDANAHIR